LLDDIGEEELYLSEGRRVAFQEIASLKVQQPSVAVPGTLNWKFVLIVCGAVVAAMGVGYFVTRE